MYFTVKKILFFCLFLTIFLNSYGRNQIDSLFKVLDQSLEDKDSFEQKKELRLNELKAFLRESGISDEQKFQLQNKLVLEYEAYQFDSMAYYINANILLAKELKNCDFLYQTELHLARILAASGRYQQASDALDELDKTCLPEDLKIEYFACKEKVYAELNVNSQVSKHVKDYSQLAKAYNDSILTKVDLSSEMYLQHLEKKLRNEKNMEECEKVNLKRLGMTKMGDRNYSIAAYERSLLYEAKGDLVNEKKYLLLSALSDCRASVKDIASLTKLAMILFEEGEVNKAYQYINYSFDDAEFFNSKLRLIEISNILPMINMVIQMESNLQKVRLWFYILIATLLSMFLAGMVFVIGRQKRKLTYARNELQISNSKLTVLNGDLQTSNLQLIDLNQELAGINQVKEQYIGNFLNICSNYIDKLNDYRKMVGKYVGAKKYSELYEMTRPGKMVDAELIEFYTNFDRIFLDIYPNFVSEMNKLLKEDEQIVLKQGEVLNTELRIFALIRLGITDSAKIAKLLRYSVNTIYNYRVKIKNKSQVARDEFENSVAKIGSYSNL